MTSAANWSTARSRRRWSVKHAIVGLTKNAAAEMCHWGIRVNCIAPHAMATPMAAEAFVGDRDDIEGTIAVLKEMSPLKGRAGLAIDVANAALFLGSDESGYTNGLCLTTDAGFTTGSRNEPPGWADGTP